MTFDDFNYHQYNRFILIDPENPNACESTESEEPATPSKKSTKRLDDGDNKLDHDIKNLTEAVLDTSVKDEYQFNEFDTQTQKQKEEARIIREQKMAEEEQKR